MTYTVDEFLDGRITLFGGDNRVVLIDAPDNSIDAVLTDGPYALVSIVKRFGSPTAANKVCGDGKHARLAKGFMGKTWDTGEVVNSVEFWKEILRVLKPGGHLLSFGGTRTYHRMACAVEDAGFEVRDMIQWLYGSGFPKSHDVSKGIDKAAGVEREVIGKRTFADGSKARDTAGVSHEVYGEFAGAPMVTAPATLAAQEWEGWGTALKPANEPIVLARKPLSEKTVAANVLKWGTGAINVDGCRVGSGSDKADGGNNGQDKKADVHGAAAIRKSTATDYTVGRFPANVILDGSDEVVAAFPSPHGAGGARKEPGGGAFESENGWGGIGKGNKGFRIGDSGSAARFFYQAKANKRDRAGSKHPTVKPIALMRYLARLITPPGGTILDPFAGSGTTGEAAYLEGFNCYLIEMEKEYQDDIATRFNSIAAPANDNEPVEQEDAA